MAKPCSLITASLTANHRLRIPRPYSALRIPRSAFPYSLPTVLLVVVKAWGRPD
jgi:hypothetical protein